MGKWCYWLALAACWQLAVSYASAQELKLATVAPDGSAWMRAMREAASEITARTDGRVTLKFYPGGVMGDDAQIMRRIRVGQLQGGALTAGGLAARYPALSIYGIPLLFRSFEEVDHVRASMDAELVTGLEAAGFVTFGFIEGGFAQLMGNTPTRGVDDMRGRKVWIPEGDDISLLALESLGISPVALPVTDVLTGLQTGLLDIVAIAPSAALVLQWHTKVRYITALPVAYSMGIPAVEARAFARLTPADQAVMREVMGEVVQALDSEARADNEKALTAMLATGIEQVGVDPAQLLEWRATLRGIYPELRARDDMDAAALDRLLAILTEFRGEQGRP